MQRKIFEQILELQGSVDAQQLSFGILYSDREDKVLINPQVDVPLATLAKMCENLFIKIITPPNLEDAELNLENRLARDKVSFSELLSRLKFNWRNLQSKNSANQTSGMLKFVAGTEEMSMKFR